MTEHFQPEVIFLDIGMMGMNGYEVAGKVRAMHGMEAVTIVALTGWGPSVIGNCRRKLALMII